MTAMIPNPASSQAANSPAAVITWPLLPDDFVLPDDPVENEAQPLLAAALTQALASLPELTQDALIVSNFALCAGINGRIICKAPDWMYVAPVQPSTRIRRSHTPHKQGAVPYVVMEFLSENDCGEYSMKSGQKIGKWHFYERVIEVPRYVIFDPDSGELEVYALERNRYELETADEQGLYLIPGINLRLGVWEGTHEIRTGPWLRWWTAEGDLVFWLEDKVQQAEDKAQQAEDKVQQAEVEARQARAEAEQERQEKAVLLAKLRAAGLA